MKEWTKVRNTLLLCVLIIASCAFSGCADNTDDKALPTAGECMVKYAKKYIGSRYSYTGKHLKNLNKKGDKNRVNCLGFVRGVMKRYAGIKIKNGRYSTVKRSILKNGGVVIGKGRKALKKAKTGDILLYKPEGGRTQHYAFYIGKKKGIHWQIDSSPRGHGVNITNVCRKRITVIRMEDQIAAKSKMYKDTIDELTEQNEDAQ